LQMTQLDRAPIFRRGRQPEDPRRETRIITTVRGIKALYHHREQKRWTWDNSGGILGSHSLRIKIPAAASSKMESQQKKQRRGLLREYIRSHQKRRRERKSSRRSSVELWDRKKVKLRRGEWRQSHGKLSKKEESYQKKLIDSPRKYRRDIYLDGRKGVQVKSSMD